MQKFLQVFEQKIFFWIFLGLLVFIPLYPKFPLVGIPLTYVAIRLEDVFIALGFGLAILIQLPKLMKLYKMAIVRSYALFWFIGLVSVISAIFVTSTVLPHLAFLHWLRRIEYMSLFFMAITAIRNLKQVKIILITFLIVTVIICLYGFGQQWLGFPVVSTTNREFSKGLILTLTPEARVNSTFAGHYDLAVYLGMVLSVISSMFFYYRMKKENTGELKPLGGWETKSLAAGGILIIVGLLSFALLGLTAARISFVATIIAIIASFWLTKKKLLILIFVFLSIVTVGVIPELRHRLVATLTVSLLGGGGAKYTPDTSGEVDPAKRLTPEERQSIYDDATASGAIEPGKKSTVASDLAPGEPINTTELGVYRSFKIREDVEWPRAYRGFMRNPLLGTGYSSLGIATDNDILRLLGETGILGATSFVLIFVIVFKKLWKQVKSGHRFAKYFGIGTIALVLGFLINGLFIDVFEASKIATLFWGVLGINWRLGILGEKEAYGKTS
ncbi:MAG TPA: hypothetical protein VJG66_03215 [Patescibacteria group bacterium]|nr:hypothetical protein [Patescibacteria group bacterium]